MQEREEVWYVSGVSAKGYVDNIEYAKRDRRGVPVVANSVIIKALDDQRRVHDKGIQEMWWCTTELLDAARLEGDTPERMNGIMNRFDGMCEAIAIMTLSEIYFRDEDGDGACEALEYVQDEAKRRYDEWTKALQEEAAKRREKAISEQHEQGTGLPEGS